MVFACSPLRPACAGDSCRLDLTGVIQLIARWFCRDANRGMEYEEIIAGLQALQASDFDHWNAEARGWERLAELTDALIGTPRAEQAIPELFSVMERLPDAVLGSPGPLVHTLERLHGYQDELVRSVRRQPSLLSVWMVNRILNTNLSDDARRLYITLLNEATKHPSASETVRHDARGFIDFQMRKTPARL